ncbi:DUF6232 family protein [Mucilaginibacter ginsenosidivorans]|uniref:QacE n=1 Tax=Mucilaginibacter ginsenosidivorans TaxID=398053 RepID=A0A5B8V2N2_9SPHI|nr:DUF6232 family protein [Mucilaginibacter ginsenosidivorans]QEC65335.1 QacE [Mucilaginibacter ginsenosidivorans]
MEETIFFQSGGVTVTQSRYIVDNKTFAMRNISSVQVGVILAKRGFGFFLLVVGLILAVSSNDARTAGIVVLILGALFAFLPKDKFTVRISTNSGETDSLWSKDRQSIQRIVDALNEAMIHRG